MRGGRTGSFPVKIHDEEPPEAFEPFQTSLQKRCVAKRSFRRARHRAEIHGYTFYRGSLCSAATLGTKFTGNPHSIPKTTNVTAKKVHLRERLSVFSWNAGGLSPSGWDWLLQWLEKQHLDVIVVQESHWAHTAEWVQDRYFVIHSGCSTRVAGLLCLVSKSLCPQHLLSWAEYIPGRLLQIRLHGHQKHVDIVAVYQHVHNVNRLHDRADLWHQLNTVLSTLSKKNTLVLLGDFNTTLRTVNAAVGTSTYAWEGEHSTGPAHSDAHLFNNLLLHFDLTALNTWEYTNSATFFFGKRSSRIDFICCRNLQSDRTARRVQYLRDFPLLCPTGACHIPLVCSVLKVWHAAPLTKTPGWSRSQRIALQKQWTQPDTHVQQVQAQLHHDLLHLPTDGDKLQHVHELLNNITPVTDQVPKVFAHKFDVTPFPRFQAHDRALKDIVGTQLKDLFRAWTHVTHRDQARKQMRKTSAAARKHKLQEIYDAAGLAARSKDHFGLYQAIRKLAPKQGYRRIILRHDNGDLMTPAQEADCLETWFAELYKDDSSTLEARSFAWPFAPDDFLHGLYALPALKALSPEFAPAPIWKFAAEPISDYLAEYFSDCAGRNCLPRFWSGGTLCFLPKHSRRSQKPSELRPITLLEPSGKALMCAFSLKLMAEVSTSLTCWPQFAYLGHRGCDEALMRLVDHCLQTRQLLHCFRLPLQQRASGTHLGAVGGGLTLSLDLSKAFDSIHRDQLVQSLQDLHVSPDLVAFLVSLYASTHYQFWHRGERRCFETSCGIRQGCCAAPGLWVVFLTSVLQDLSHQTTLEWVRNCATTYADDCCFHEIFHSVNGFHRLLRFLGKVLDVLEARHLKVNLSKTVAILRMAGPHSRKLQRQYVRRCADGAYLCIPRANGHTTMIKLVRQFQYLGTTLGYHAFEKHTMINRIKASEKASQQLHRWLHVRRSLSIGQKLMIWQQCIFSCLKHGLTATGFTPSTLKLFDTACIKQLRRICRAPTHLQRNTNSAFLAERGLPDPLLLLLEVNDLKAQSVADRSYHLDANDILQTSPCTDFHARHVLILEVWRRLRGSPTPSDLGQADSWVCPQCVRPFQSLAALRRHLTIDHDDRPGALRQFTKRDAAGGVPTCARCGHQFSTIQQLEYHVTYVCTLPRQDDTEVEHRLRVQEMLQYARGFHLQALATSAPLLAYFYTRCALCSTFCTTVQGLLSHWKLDHADTFAKHEIINDEILERHVPTNPCVYCGQTYKRYHKCHILRQLALLLVEDGYVASQSATTTLICSYCSKAYTTKHGLQRHMAIYHQAEQDAQQMAPHTVEMHCLVSQAVVNDDIMDLLGNEAVQHFLATQCLSCCKDFARKNELKRHLRIHHSSEWHECERRAMSLDDQYKPTHGCLCQPVSHQKHLCVLYIQYALLRLEHERQQAPVVMALPPDSLLSNAEKIESLMWLGYSSFLYLMRELRVQLTVNCQLCGWSGLSAEELHVHLHAMHPQNLQEILHLKHLFQWCMFGDFGCFCNPGQGFGREGHECVALTQLALIVHEFQWQVVIPWPFASTDLVQLLGDMLPLPALKKIGMALMSRNFHLLWKDVDLRAMLASRCLLCQETVDLKSILAHLRVVHHIGHEGVQFIAQQLCVTFADLQSPDWHCDWCNCVLPSYFTDDDVITEPMTHLLTCPMVVQMSLLLMMPKWSKPAFEPFAWPRREDLEYNWHQMELKRWQFNAQPSDLFGMDLDLLARGGLDFLQDAWIFERLPYQCLLCGKNFFLPKLFEQHLHQQHNFKQLQTVMCLHRLMLTCDTPCQFCSQPKHISDCIPLLNLAVFLINGHGLRGRGRAGRSQSSLEPSVDCRSNFFSGHLGQAGGTRSQESQSPRQTGQEEKQTSRRLDVIWVGDSPEECPGHLDEASHQARGLIEHADVRDTVCVMDVTGQRQRSAGDDGSITGLACRGPSNQPQTHPCPNDGANDGGSSPRPEDHGGECRGLPGMQSAAPHLRRCSENHALSSLEPCHEELGAQLQAGFASGRGAALAVQHTTHHERPDGHTALPRVEEGQGGRCNHNSVVMDSGHAGPGTLSRVDEDFLSLHVASHPDPATSPDPRTSTISQAITADTVNVKSVRILLNSTGTMCFVNSVLTSLAWLMLMADGFHHHLWHGGFELMRNVTMYRYAPLDLYHFKPFRWLLIGTGVMSAKALDRQQDAIEFCTALLSQLCPGFLHCGWVTRPAFLADASAMLLSDQKGHQFTPIAIPFIDVSSDDSCLQDLIEFWHDDLGLCKGITEAGKQLVLSLDRALDVTDFRGASKCTQRVTFPDNAVLFPCFADETGTIDMLRFEICAIVFHLGQSLNSGHYRAALRYRGMWYVYDDGKVPDKLTELPDFILRNTVLYWLVMPTLHTDRTMNAGEPLRGTTGSGWESTNV